MCRFDKRDVVRHPLVARIVEAYDQREAAQKDARRGRTVVTAEVAGS